MHVTVYVQVLLRELVAITGEISEEELQRAKTQLKSMLLMNLESRPVIFEDCARQVLSIGERRNPQHFISLIDKVGLHLQEESYLRILTVLMFR